MKKKTIKTLSLQKHTIANLQSLTGGNGIDRNLGLSKVSDSCPPISQTCNDTQRGEICQRTIA